MIGPKVEIHLWRPLYLDAEALYSHPNYVFPNSTLFIKRVIDRWEVPILLKWTFNSHHFVRPFATAGVSFEHSLNTAIPPSASFSFGPGLPGSAVGTTFGLGASLGTHWVRPSIEFRYTRWMSQPITTGDPTAQAKQDEAQILAGLTFGVGKDQPDKRGVLEGPPSTRRISLGIKGGLLLTDSLSTQLSRGPGMGVLGNCLECGTSRTLPYVVGPALEVRIVDGVWGGLSATAEALYSHADYNHTSAESVEDAETGVAEEKHAVGRWEAPLLLKYSLKIHGLTPFVSAGASIQYDRDSQVQGLLVLDELFQMPPALQFISNPTSGAPVDSLVVGPTAGIGVSFDARRVRPSIELRYTHWNDRAIAVSPPAVFDGTLPPGTPHTIFSTHNQLQLLVGLMF